MRESLTETILRRITADAIQRWGPGRTSALADALASTAETLALVATVDFDVDEAEPDPGVFVATLGIRR